MFSRASSIYGAALSNVVFALQNATDDVLRGISLACPSAPAGARLPEPVSALGARQRVDVAAHLDFGGQCTPLNLVLTVGGQRFAAKLAPAAGDLLQPLDLSAEQFAKHVRLLSGMHCSQVALPAKPELLRDPRGVVRAVQGAANMAYLAVASAAAGEGAAADAKPALFAARVLSPDGGVALVVATPGADGQLALRTHCDDIAFLGPLAQAIAASLRR